MRECITHHMACDCREEKFAAMEVRIAELEATVNRLRGQLQNCVNHLERAKRRIARTDDFDACIESANKALYEAVEVK